MSVISKIKKNAIKIFGNVNVDSTSESGTTELLRRRLGIPDDEEENSPRSSNSKRTSKKKKNKKSKKTNSFTEEEMKTIRSEVEKNYYKGEATTVIEQCCTICMNHGDKSLLSSLLDSNWVSGVFVVTNFRMLFFKITVDFETKKWLKTTQKKKKVGVNLKLKTSDKSQKFKIFLSAPLCTLYKVEKYGGKNFSSKVYSLLLYMKDLRIIKIGLSAINNNRDMIMKMLMSPMPTDFAFAYKFRLRNDSKIVKKKIFDLEKEFGLRQQVVKLKDERIDELLKMWPKMKRPKKGNVSYKWRISRINEDYSFCKTYPKGFVVPLNLLDEDLYGTSKFRSKQRIPILSWADKTSGVSIFRSSQPKQMKKNPEPDIEFLRSIKVANYYQNPLLIVDMRPKINAVANQFFRGGGYEKSYKETQLRFLNIENIHEMRKCFKSLMELCSKTGGAGQTFFEEVGKTNWLLHIKLNLRAALFCVKYLERKNQSILIHCSDGWDRTSSCSAITQILIDPFFRTLEGFAVLIEKEWLAPGHQFQKRIGTGYRDFFTESDRSPIFLQFIECVNVIRVQHPTAFEFNEQYLVKILDEMYSARFGNFLFDCESQREENGVFEDTEDLWTYLLSEKVVERYQNPFYEKKGTKQTIIPDLRESEIKFWSNYWLRYFKPVDIPMVSMDNLSIFHYHNSFKNANVTLFNKGKSLKNEIKELKEKSDLSISINEKTVNVFQKEISKMSVEIAKLREENEKLKLKLKKK